jgi:hypothetical protein
MTLAAAMTGDVDRALRDHLVRADGQEDVCFALWRPSQGAERLTALVSEPILPDEGERHVHGNASFEGRYLARAAALAAESGAGLALVHSHPGGCGWQRMSDDDVDAEHGNAARVRTMTGLPFLGLTLATGDGCWSARLWQKTAPRSYERRDCEVVKTVGQRLRVTFHPSMRPRPAFREELTRTISAWSEETQADVARLRVGVVGLGSVGSIVGEALARMGIEHIRLIDFDAIETLNLDRVLHATAEDARLGLAKVAVAARALRASATAADPRIDPLEWSVVEEAGFRAAIDCDVLFSCVDRPWPRAALNLLAYAHLIPVIDGGIVVSRTKSGKMRGADWRVHVAAPERRCLECLRQYDPGLVAIEREGRFDDPHYIEHLADEDPLRRNENVFAFSVCCAGLEIGQFLSMVVAPAGISSYGAQMYHFALGSLERDEGACDNRCPYAGPLLAQGDHSGLIVTAPHKAAEDARGARQKTSECTSRRLPISSRLKAWIKRLAHPAARWTRGP